MLHDFKTEYAKNVSLSIQRLLTPTLEVEANYLGSWIVGADSSTVLNVPVPGPGAIGPRRPVPQLSNITAIRWDGYSTFHSVTFKAEKRVSHGLAASASYMVSKAIDDASDPGATSHEVNLPQDIRNMRAGRALASFDHRHRFIGSFSYAVPDLSRGSTAALSALGRAWRLSGLVGGEPATPTQTGRGDAK